MEPIADINDSKWLEKVILNLYDECCPMPVELLDMRACTDLVTSICINLLTKKRTMSLLAKLEYAVGDEESGTWASETGFLDDDFNDEEHQAAKQWCAKWITGYQKDAADVWFENFRMDEDESEDECECGEGDECEDESEDE